MRNLKKLAVILAVSALCAGTAFISFGADVSNTGSKASELPGMTGGAVIGSEYLDKSGRPINYQELDPEDEELLKDEEAVKGILEDAGFVVPSDAEVTVLGEADSSINEK